VFDLMNMANSPQAREMLFKMMSKQMGQVPPEVKEAISKVEVIIKRNERGFELRLGKSDNPVVEKMLKDSTASWIEMLSRGFQAVGYKVKIYE
jgi:alanyl-tRNA synthetase